MQSLYRSIANNDVAAVLASAEVIPNSLENGLTPLQHAAVNDAADLVSMLIFQARLLNKQGKTALYLAAQKNALNSARILAPHESRMLANGVSALEEAAARGHLDMVYLLLSFEPERAKMAMFRARAHKKMDVANLIKQWLVQQGNPTGYSVANLSQARIDMAPGVTMESATEKPELRSTSGSLGYKSPLKSNKITENEKAGIISGIFSDDDNLEVEELARSVVYTKQSSAPQEVQTRVLESLRFAAYDDPTELLYYRTAQLELDLSDCKTDYYKAVRLCEQYRDAAMGKTDENSSLKKYISCLKVELGSYAKKFEQYQSEINFHAVGNEKMKEKLAECQYQLMYKQNQLYYYQGQNKKREEELYTENAYLKAEAQRIQAELAAKQNYLVQQTELLDYQVHECDTWREQCLHAEAQDDASLDEINKLQAECAEQREVLGYAAAQNELAQQEIKQLKLLIENEDVKYLMGQLEKKAEDVFVPTIKKLKEKMGV